MNMPHTLDWDGEHVPEALKQLPPGRYVLVEVDAALSLSAEEENGLREALSTAEAGEGRTLAEVRSRVRQTLSKK
jgi:hypothetical protein